MCGIFGQIAIDGTPPDPSILETALGRLNHRGPDDAGTIRDGPLIMGARRLAVIDIAGGHQPLPNEDETVWVVFNGEIYNHNDLRRELEQRGHTFRTRCDTEVLVHLYEQDPEHFLERLNGMFALALWDARRQRLILARDRAGMKPLFIAEWAGSLYFASEMKALLVIPGFPRDWDYQALDHYFSFYYTSAPSTLYRHIRRVMPGECVIVEGGRTDRRRFWNLCYSSDWKPRREDLIPAFRSLLDEAVRRHLQSEVPTGVFLSGGLDSASLVAMMTRHVDRVRTYTVGYEETTYNELEVARKVSERFGTDHHECILTPDLVREELPYAINQLDEPHGDWTYLAHSRLSRFSHDEGVTVVYVGAGGDELFGGYPTYLAARIARIYRRVPGMLRRGLIERLVNRLPASYQRMSFDFKAKSFVAGASLDPERAHLRFKEVFSADQRQALFTPELQVRIGTSDPFDVFAQHLDRIEESELINRLMYLDFKTFLPDDTLYPIDIVTSAHSQECRAPLLDTEIIEFAARIPWQWKLRGATTKYLIRQAMKETLPRECVRMPKKGFLVPGGPWLRGPLHEFARQIIGDAAGRTELFERTEMERLLAEHCSGRADHTRRLTCLLSFLLWAD